MELTSSRNPLLQKIRRAAATGKPTEDGLIIAEGPHLLEEAQRGDWSVEQVFATPLARERYRELFEKTDAHIIEVSERALSAVSVTDTPQNVVALLRPPSWSWSDLTRQPALVVVLDRIQDPGNLGAIVRSAEAFGSNGVVFLKGCARVSNGKALRAAAGSLFRIPFLEDISGGSLIERAQLHGWKLYALAAQAKTPILNADLRGPCALLVGSEGAGVAPELLANAEALSIPTASVESLNAAVACSIALYEASQQRRPA